MDDATPSKRCRICGVRKPLDAFHRDARNRDGRKTACIECYKAKRRAYETSSEGRAHQKAYRASPARRAWWAGPAGQATKRRERLKQYGLTSEQYEAMLVDQGGVCAICGEPPDGRRLGVDHDHETGGVRGLLCIDCNLGLGKFGDDPKRLRAAADYLERRG